jgi:hypothetical protein
MRKSIFCNFKRAHAQTITYWKANPMIKAYDSLKPTCGKTSFQKD